MKEHTIEISCKNYTCTKGHFDKENYLRDLELYTIKLNEYKHKSWIKKLFESKPIEPNPQSYIIYY